MEQRRGSTSQPLEGAGFDPAFIPGLTSPVSGGPEDVRPAKTEPKAEPESEAVDVRDADEAAAGEPPAEDLAGESAEKSGEPDEQEAPEGPVFEASDRRARIVADRRGVRLALDDQSCEFRWDEVGAVETETGRFGKRFTVTVHTPDSRWYPIEIEATSRSRFKEWEAALDEVLDAYFDDGEAEAGAESDLTDGEADGEADDVKAEAEPDGKPEPAPEAGADSDAGSEAKTDLGRKE
ncbi:hypothetical protein [Streptomyces sp. NPDC017890]|uniref:hypothetical protein n=1 Tax=Streptomyces sp. NPDC017890 TaxID=3365015 RepID=UPI0037A156A1